MENNNIILLIADDHPLFRQGMVDGFSLETDIIVSGQASYGTDAWVMLQTNNYDVAILDWNMPGLDGIELAKKVQENGLKTKIIIISGHVDGKLTVEFILAGVSAYVSKDIEPSELLKIVREVSKGLCLLPHRNKKKFGSPWVTKDEAVDWAEKELLAQKEGKAKWEALKDAYENWKRTNSGRR